VNLVIINARQGLKKVKTFNDSTDPLQSSHGLTVSENLEAGLRNASIKFLSNVVCKVGGGTASWLAVTAYFDRRNSGHEPTPSDSLITGAVATSVLLTYTYIIEFLEEVLEQPIFVAAIGWILWVIQSVVSRTRQLIERLPPLPRFSLDREAVVGAWLSLVGSDVVITNRQLGSTDIINATAPLPEDCGVTRRNRETPQQGWRWRLASSLVHMDSSRIDFAELVTVNSLFQVR